MSIVGVSSDKLAISYRSAVFRGGGIVLGILPSLLVVLLLPRESSSLHDVPWLGATYYIYTVFTCLYTGDSTTPLLSAHRVSALRFGGINKHDNFRVPYVVLSLFEAKGVE